MTLKQLHTILSDVLRNQAERHGYHMTDAEVRDISGNQAQAIAGLCDEDERELAAIDAENWRREMNEPRVTVDADQMWRPGC